MAWMDIMNALSKVPENAALKVHLEAAWRESDELKEKIGKLAEEVSATHNEARGLRKENELLKAQLAELDRKPIVVDIGPCAIKLNKQGRPLLGVYCNACGSQFERACFGTSREDLYRCRKCGEFRKPGDVDASFKFYLEPEGE